MTTDEIIRDEKVQYYINREAVNIYTLLSGTIDEYKYFAGKEILPPQQSRNQNKLDLLTLHLEKHLTKKINTNKDQ